ncbi:MAG TPA: site-specific integrase [Candidatus Ligilactobacillus excrementavium]|nr:site-specific integrase [Candidatus Ligilactobacillus excrementavium]
MDAISVEEFGAGIHRSFIFGGEIMSKIMKKTNGDFVVLYSMGSGSNRIRLTRSFKTKAAATAYLAELTLRYGGNHTLYRQQLTLASYLKFWVSLQKKNVRQGTLNTYLSSMTHINKAFPKLKLKDVNQPLLQAGFNQLGQIYSHETLRKDANHLRAMFRYAVRVGDIRYNPMDDVVVGGTDLHHQADASDKVMKAADFQALRSFLEDYEFQLKDVNRLIVSLIMHTGIRVGEALGLARNNIDFTANTITITQAWSQGRVGPTKTKNAERVIPVSALVMQQLKRWCKLRDAYYTEHQLVNEQDLFFRNKDGKIPRPSSITACYKQLQNKLDLECSFSIHTVRHTLASVLLEKGADMVQISKLLGHANTSITSRYYLGLVPDNALEKRRELLQSLNG